VSKPVFALYFREAGDGLWTVDGQPFDDPDMAERVRGRMVGQARGRRRVEEAMVLRFPSAGDVKMFLPVGKEREWVPAQASSEVRAVPVEAKATKLKGSSWKTKPAAGTARRAAD